MTKKHFIALAEKIQRFTNDKTLAPLNESDWVRMLADFCEEQNSNFNRDRWMNYIAGKCGSNGGKIKKSKVAYV